RTKEDGIHHAEHGGVAANAYRQRQDRGRRERFRAAQKSKGVSYVRDDVVKRGSPHVSAALRQDGDVAKLSPRQPRRLVRRDAAPDKLLGLFLEMLPHLLGQIAIG